MLKRASFIISMIVATTLKSTETAAEAKYIKESQAIFASANKGFFNKAIMQADNLFVFMLNNSSPENSSFWASNFEVSHYETQGKIFRWIAEKYKSLLTKMPLTSETEQPKRHCLEKAKEAYSESLKKYKLAQCFFISHYTLELGPDLYRANTSKHFNQAMIKVNFESIQFNISKISKYLKQQTPEGCSYE